MHPFLYHLIALVTVAIWGSTFISTKILLAAGLSAVQIFTLRFLIAYVLMLTVSHKQLFARSLKDEALMLLLGVTGGSLYFYTENEALVYSAATNVSLIVCSCPLFTVLLFRVFVRGTRLSNRLLLGTLLALFGMAAVVLNGQFVLHLSPLGDFLALVACLCWALYSIFMKFANERYSSAFITRKVFFYGLLTILPYYFLYPEMPSWDVLSRPEVAGNLLFLGVVASWICFLTWTWVMRKLGALVATNYVYVNPVSTIVFASLILDERITPYFILGTVLIIAGTWLSSTHGGKLRLLRQANR